MIKKLAANIKEYKKYAIIAPISVVCESIFELIMPLITASMIDKGIKLGNINHVLKMGGVLLGVTVIALGFGVLSGRCTALAGAGFAKNLRHTLYYKVQDYSFSNIDKFSTASIITRLTTDVANLQNAFQMILRVAVRCPSSMIIAFIMAVKINARLSLIFLCVLPLLGLGLYIIMKTVHPIFNRVFKTYDRLNNIVQEDVRGMRVVKSYVREDYETEKFKGISNTIAKDFIKAERILAFNMPLMQLAMNISLLCIAWFGAKTIVVDTGFTTGDLTSLMSYASNILFSLLMISMVFTMITMSRASAQRIVELLDEETDIKDNDNPIFDVKDGSIEFKNVSFSYAKDNERLCLKNVNLDIKSGETIGIIGGTGSSKSSLVQLIPRLYDTANGEVEVGGVNVKNYDLKALRDSVAMVLQKNELFSGTIKENLRWGNPNASDEEIIHACKLSCADEFVEKFPDKYDTFIEQGGANVSGGQKQRLCIARALLKNPRILILDDSTSAVDTMTDSKIRNSFKGYIPDTTKIIIAQRIASVMDADKIIVMDNGEINAVGTHEELMKTNSIYSEVFYSQQNGGLGDE